MKIMATKDLAVFSFCSSLFKTFFAFSGLMESIREKKIITELAPKANIIGRKILKLKAVIMGINMPKKIAALWGQNPIEKAAPQAKEPNKFLLVSFLCESCSQQCSFVLRFIRPKTIKRTPIIISPFSLKREISTWDNPKNNITVKRA